MMKWGCSVRTWALVGLATWCGLVSEIGLLYGRRNAGSSAGVGMTVPLGWRP
jgi:hypothetical protein